MSDSLICLLIKEDFGDKFAEVVELFLKQGEITLQEFIQESKLPFEEAKNILIILIKHNIITFRTKSDMAIEGKGQNGGEMVDEVVYKVSVPDVIHRLR